MEVGVVGKPNVGKSTLFNALTLLDVAMAPYPFTTVEPNRGIGAIRAPCPHAEKGTPCTPGNSPCVDGTRWVPVRLLDVPGLVPGAHEGKGLGYKFLDDLRAADGFMQVVDASGATTAEGSLAAPGSVDPADEVLWLQQELVAWVTEILGRDWIRHARPVEQEGRKVEEFLGERLTGLSIGPARIATALRLVPLDRDHVSRWTEEDRRRLVVALLDLAKPRLVVANKSDRVDLPAVSALRDRLAPIPVQATAADAELTLRRAARAGLVRYRPGGTSFTVAETTRLNPAQQKALDGIAALLHRWGTTGVQEALERMVLERLGQMVVFPVEDELHWTDTRGRVLPDAFIVPQGTQARAFAYAIHTDLGENFVRAIDGRTHRAMAADHPLEPGAIVRIAARK
jgi:ribosome-binding ATPase YchF (GTP1/OBG family)